MAKEYHIKTSSNFDKQLKKLVKNNTQLRLKVIHALQLMLLDPLIPNLRSHKVRTKKYGEVYSSRVTGDIRIIWQFIESGKFVILCLAIGGHDKVY